MNKRLLILSCLACLLNTADAKSERFQNTVSEFFIVNPKMRGVVSYLRSVLAEQAGEWLKSFKVSISSERDLVKEGADFGSPLLTAEAQFGFNTFFDLLESKAAAQSSRYSSFDPSVVEIEKITVEYLEMAININLKRGFLRVVDAYVLAKRNDIKEGDIRARYNDISIAEKAEFKANAADAEHAYIKLQNDLSALEKSYKVYNPAFVIENNQVVVPELALEDLEAEIDFNDDHTKFTSLALEKAEISLNKTRASLMSAAMSYMPQVKIVGRAYLNLKEHRELNEIDRASLVITLDLSPVNFMKTCRQHGRYEHAKCEYMWEASKYESEYSKTLGDVKVAKSGYESAKLTMEAKRVALEDAIAQYRAGAIVHSKLSQARTDYYNYVERYYSYAERYVKAMLEYLKFTGKIRKIFLEQLDKEIGK